MANIGLYINERISLNSFRYQQLENFQRRSLAPVRWAAKNKNMKIQYQIILFSLALLMPCCKEKEVRLSGRNNATSNYPAKY